MCSTLLLGGSVSGAPLMEKVEQKYALPPNAEITVRNTDGTIYLYGAEEDELKIVARKKAYSKERLDAISVQVSIEGNKATVDTKYPPRPEGLGLSDRSGTVDYVIVVPEHCTLSQVELTTGEIIVDGLRGPAVNARLTTGRLLTQNCFTALNLSVIEGRIAVTYLWWLDEPVSLFAEIKQGDVRLALPDAPAVRLDAVSMHGHVANAFGEERGQNTGSALQTTIGADNGGEFKIRVDDGNIKIEKAY
jgi:outer membrane lipoprotein SlyB